jgi:hypothetical protein
MALRQCVGSEVDLSYHRSADEEHPPVPHQPQHCGSQLVHRERSPVLVKVKVLGK